MKGNKKKTGLISRLLIFFIIALALVLIYKVFGELGKKPEISVDDLEL